MYAFAVLADLVYRRPGSALPDNRRVDGLNLVGRSSRRDLRRLRFCLFLRCRNSAAGPGNMSELRVCKQQHGLAARSGRRSSARRSLDISFSPAAALGNRGLSTPPGSE